MASGTKIADMTVGLHFDGKGMYVDMKDISKKAENIAGGAGETSGTKFSKKMGLAMGAVAGIASSIFSKVTSAVTSSFDSAINRMDTMNNFPKVMQSLGYAAEDASASVGAMSDHLDGLPTSLNDMTSNVQSLAATMGNLNKGTVNATSVGLAFNDMMLAGGQGTQAASNAFMQYNQMLAAGKVDQQAWNSLVTAAPGQMDQLSKSILGASANQKDLYEALKEGTVSFDDMNAAMVRLDAEGGEGFESFNSQAIAGTEGLATEIENLQNQITKVMTAALNGEDMAAPIDKLVKRFDGLAKKLVPAVGRIVQAVVTALPEMLNSLFSAIISYLPEFAKWLSSAIPTLLKQLSTMAWSLVQQLVPMLPSIINSLIVGILDALKALTSPEHMQFMLKTWFDLLTTLIMAIPDIIIAIVDALPDIIDNIVAFLTDPANIMMIINAAVRLFMGLVQAVPRILGHLFEAFGNLFGKLWDRVKTLFTEFAGHFGEAVGGVFKNAVNGVLSFLENFINTPIRAINGLIDTINNVPGIDLGKLGELHLPRLAQGGIAMSGTTAIIGEAGREAVLPLDRNTDNWSGLVASALADEFEQQSLTAGRTINVYMTNEINNNLDADEIGRRMMTAIRRAV